MALTQELNSLMGERVAWLWKQGAWKHQKDMAVAMGDTEGILSKVFDGEYLTVKRLLRIAQVSAGRGNVIDDVGIVLLFIVGLKEERDVWVPSLSLVGEAEAARRDKKGYPESGMLDWSAAA